MNAESFLTEKERAEVEEAVERAEDRTAAELACGVATESDRYDRAESLAGLGLGLVFLGLLDAGYGVSLGAGGSWEAGGGVAFAWQSVAVVAGFVLGSVIASYWHGLRRLMVSPEHLTVAVERAAWRVFGRRRVSSTEQRSGILIYVSLFERRVSVLADETAREILGKEGIETLKETAVDQLAEGRSKETFVATIEKAAELLESELPAGEQDVDELADHLEVFHPRPD